MHNLSVLVVFNLNKLSLAVLEECIHMQNRALFLVWEGPFSPLWVSLHFIQYLLACFWIRADLINSSFPCPSLQAMPPWPGAVLCSQHSPQPSCCPFPAFQTFPWGHVRVRGTRAGVWNSRISAPPRPGALPVCIHKAVCLISHHDLLVFFFNKEQIWVLIYKS